MGWLAVLLVYNLGAYVGRGGKKADWPERNSGAEHTRAAWMGDGSAGWLLGHGAMGRVRPDLLVERELIARIERNMQCK